MLTLSLQRQAVWVLYVAHMSFWEYAGNRQPINEGLFMQYMSACKLIVNQWLRTHSVCEVFSHVISVWGVLRKTSWHLSRTHGACSTPLLPDWVVRKAQVPQSKNVPSQVMFPQTSPSTTAAQSTVLCSNTALLLYFPASVFLLAAILCIIGVCKSQPRSGLCFAG